MERLEETTLLLCAIALTLLILATLVRSILGPRFTDRVVAVNMVNTMVVAILAILALLLDEDYLVDIALVYALLSFLAVVVLSRLVTTRRREQREREKREENEKNA